MRKRQFLFTLALGFTLIPAVWAEAPAVREAADLRSSGEVAGVIEFCGAQGPNGATADLVGESFSATAGASGTFHLRYVPEGSYSLRIRIPNQPPATIAVQVVKSQVSDVGVVRSCADYDQDGFTPDPSDPVGGNDCNDNNAAINPYALEICDGYDNDCDGQVDGPNCTWCTDVDNDGFFAQTGCGPLADCNDEDDTVRPNAPEVCDGVDNDCDGVVDDGFDLQTDSINCGQCSHVCDGVECVDGSCLCPAGSAECAPGWCVDLQTNRQHCGSCGQPCASGYFCEGGMCTICTPGVDCISGGVGCPDYHPQFGGPLIACSGTCVNTQNDEQNCGGCGNACAAGQTCENGQCAACPGSLTQCGESCVDLSSDPANCGGCGQACPGDMACVSGTCL